MALVSMRYMTTVDEDADPAPTLQDYLRQYGYVLKQPNGWMMLAGFLDKKQLQYARSVIEAKYPPAPLLTVVSPMKHRQLKAAA